MPNKFKYINGLTHGAYQFRYQHKEKPTYYKFQYKNGICHGIYKFTYGEKEKPIYVERSTHPYTYWGREIDVEHVVVRFPSQMKHISLQDTIELIKRAIKYIERVKYYRLDQEKSLKQLISQPLHLLEINQSKEVNFLNDSITVQRPKEQLNLLEDLRIMEHQEKYIDFVQIDKLLEVLAVLQVEVSNEMGLSTRDDVAATIEEQIDIEKTDYTIKLFKSSELNQQDPPEISVFENEIFHRALLNQMQIESIQSLERAIRKEIGCFIGKLKELARVDIWGLYNPQNSYRMDRVTELNLLAEVLEFIGSKKKNKDALCYIGTERFTHKYLKAHVSKTRRLDKKVHSCRLGKSTLLERIIEKDMLQEVHKALKRIILKDILVDIWIYLLVKGKERDIQLNHLEQYMNKLINREISQHKKEILFEKIVIRELSTLIHDKILTFTSNKELIQIEIVQQLTKLQDRIRFIQVDNQEQYIEDITKYPLFIEQVTQGVQDELRNMDIEALSVFIEEMLRDIELESTQVKVNTITKELYQENLNVLSKELLMQLEESEQTLKLYKRFWIVSNSDFKDLLILPDHDYPYESDPVIEDVELIPENHHVVYPNEFYKCIDKHPIPNGIELAPNEIGVSINILIDFINIFIMMWCKFTPAFWGWTGTQAVIGMVDSIYEFMTLETSREWQLKEDVKEQYDRAYKWIRWEGEQIALRARHDPGLRGNYYVGIMLEELIYYMQDHHFDIMPLFEDVNKMDEWRTMFDRDVNNDIKFVLDKVKGIRHKLLEREVSVYES